MGKFTMRIAVDRRRRDLSQRQHLGQLGVGAGRRVAVDEMNLGPGQILDRADTQRLPFFTISPISRVTKEITRWSLWSSQPRVMATVRPRSSSCGRWIPARSQLS